MIEDDRWDDGWMIDEMSWYKVRCDRCNDNIMNEMSWYKVG